ncbi:MAG: thiamine pyrophosphate-dependent dehydrogenase E1 component subunit alpha [Acidimicrobiia bacterium]|nr:thiamine pyrophosphate-dependent dehydrogenase E1 component subunit alpha [Acidimicrobiia bacterium]
MPVPLTPYERRDLHYWMRLTRTLDDQIITLWKQGRGVGGTFNQRGHEAISVGAGAALGPDDVVAPMHRDLGCYLLRGMTPERLLASQLGRATSINGGRDANLHGCGDLSLNIIGFVSHLPQSLPVAVGAAMSFTYRREPRVAMTFVGDGSSNTGLFHESLNLAAVHRAPFVLIIENNQYAYSTPLSQQMAIDDIAIRATAHGVRSTIVDGNEVEAVHAAAQEAVDRARDGGGPTAIECKTMRMLGHAIHDGAEYVPAELLANWERLDPIDRFERALLEDGAMTSAQISAVAAQCRDRVAAAVVHAEGADWPDPATVTDGIYAP